MIWSVLCVYILLLYTYKQTDIQTAHIQTYDIFDDSDETIFPRAPFTIMSEFDTTYVDQNIAEYFETSLADTDGINETIAQERIEEICLFYDDICTRISYDPTHTQVQKYVYLLYSTYLITQVDNNIQLTDVWTLRSQIGSISFFKSADGRRWQAWTRTILINTQLIDSKKELFEIMTHEIAWHILDLGVIRDDISKKSKKFLEVWKEKFGVNDRSLKFYELSWVSDSLMHNTDFASHYGWSNPYEGFAEFSNAWINHHAPLIKLAQQNENILRKYLLFRELFGSWHIHLDIDGYRDMPLSKKPCDTTNWLETLRSDDINEANCW